MEEKNWKNMLKGDPTDWLLEKTNPSVRYWTLKDLMDEGEESPEVIKIRRDIMGFGPVKEILEHQNQDGAWVHPDRIYYPKYKGTTHSLLILSELGAVRNRAIEKAIEIVFKCQLESGHFLTKPPKTERGYRSKITDGICLTSNILHYLIHFGYLDDPRTHRVVQFLIDSHSKQGGWHCRVYPIEPEKIFPIHCYMGGVKPLIAFSKIPEEKRTGKMKDIIRKNIEIYLENRIFKYRRDEKGERVPKPGWTRFGFPLFYQSDALEVLDVLTSLGVHDERMQEALDLLLAKQTSQGTWLLENTFKGKMWVDIEEKRKPSKWITLKALRVLKRYYGYK